MVPCNPDKSLRLRLDSKDIVFRRSHRDGQKQVLQGDVTFYTQSPTTIKSVKVILKGTRKVSWLTDTLQPQHIQQKETILHQEQKLHVYVKDAAQASRAEPGLYTWPFVFTLSADLPESVNWLPSDTYICYTLTAEVTTGILSKVTSTTEHLRLIKSPSFWADDLYFAPEMRELSFPSDDATCLISLPQPYQPTDGELDLDFTLTTADTTTPIKIDSITLDLSQILQLVVTKDGKPWRTAKNERRIATTTKTPAEIAASLDAGPPCVGEGGCATIRFTVPLPLPMAPYSCSQSVDEETLKVRYKLRVTVKVQDAEGETCEQSVHLFPKLFTPIWTRRGGTSLAPSSGGSSRSGSSSVVDGAEPDGVCTPPYDSSVALPLYGEHVFDALYCGEVPLAADDMLDFADVG